MMKNKMRSEKAPIFTREDLLRFHAFIPKRCDFATSGSGIHGIGHILRVMAYTAMICRECGVDSLELVLAASIHDLRRESDGADTGHGNRAWEWYSKEAFGLSEEALFSCRAAVVYHDVEYEDIPAHESGCLAVDIIKAADAFDRYVQPEARWWPDTNRIRLKRCLWLMPFCKKITIESDRDIQDGENPVKAVQRAVLKYSKSWLS